MEISSPCKCSSLVEEPMPFDGMPNDLVARLERLRELLKGMTDRSQGSWATCLWSRVVEDAQLRAMGLPRSMASPWMMRIGPERQHVEFFGGFAPFGCDSVADKMGHLDEAIALLKKKQEISHASMLSVN